MKTGLIKRLHITGSRNVIINSSSIWVTSISPLAASTFMCSTHGYMEIVNNIPMIVFVVRLPGEYSVSSVYNLNL